MTQKHNVSLEGIAAMFGDGGLSATAYRALGQLVRQHGGRASLAIEVSEPMTDDDYRHAEQALCLAAKRPDMVTPRPWNRAGMLRMFRNW